MKPKTALRHLLFASTLLATVNNASATEYWWNQNDTAPGWGAGGAWDAASAVFSTINDPLASAAAATTNTSDTLNFGTATTGFGGGNITFTAGQFIGNIVVGSANTGATTLVNFTRITTLGAAANITNNSNFLLDVQNVLAGAATSITVNDSGAGVNFSTGANTYTGLTNLDSGLLLVNNLGNLGTTGTDANRTNVASGATVRFNNDVARTFAERFVIAGAGVGGTAGALANTTRGALTATVSGSVTLSAAATAFVGSGSMTFSGGIALGSNALTFNSAGTTTVQTGGITGTGGSVVKNGVGTLNFNATNTYDGGSTISEGALFFFNTNAKPSTGTHAFSAGTTLGLGVAAAGAFFTDTDITSAFAGGVMTGNLSNVTVTGTTNVGIDTSGNFTYSGSVAGNPTKALIKTGAATLSLDGVNTYTGATSILAGQLTLNGSLTGGTAISTSGTATFFQSGTGIISGTSSYTQTSSGVSTLGGNNSYNGGTTLSAGTLRINSATAIGTGALNLTVNNVVFDNNSGGTVILGNNNVVNFTANPTFTGTNSLSNGTGNFTINGTRTITVSANRLTLGGNQTTVVAGGIVKAGAGTLTLLGTGVHTGGSTISGGVLEVGVMNNGGNASSVGNTSNAAANLKLNNGTTLRYVGSANAVTDRAFTIDTGTAGHGAIIESSGDGTFSFSGGPVLAYGTGGAAQTRVLTLGGTNTGANTFGKVISSNGGGAISLIKANAGTWVLDQTNTYTGTTTVSGGTLKFGANNVLADTTNVFIGTATLDADTRTDTAGTLDVTGNATINLGPGAALAFTNAAGSWAGTLNVTGVLGPTSLRFGLSGGTLSFAQLAVISVNGSGLGTYVLDGDGYLIPGGGATAYDTWKAVNAPSGNPDDDFDLDGVSNAVEFMLGGLAATRDLDKLPVVSQTGGNLELTFTCLKLANRGPALLRLQYSKDLGITDLWTSHEVAVPDTAGPVGLVTFTVPTVNANPSLINLKASIPASEAAPGTKLFGRLKAQP